MLRQANPIGVVSGSIRFFGRILNSNSLDSVAAIAKKIAPMRKFLALILVITMTPALAACGWKQSIMYPRERCLAIIEKLPWLQM